MTEALTLGQRRATAGLGVGAPILVWSAAAAGIWFWPEALRIALIAGIAFLACTIAMMAVAARRPVEAASASLELEALEADEEHHLRFHCSQCRHFTEAPDDGTRPLPVVCTHCGKQGMLE